MQKTDTYDRTTEASEPKQRSKSRFWETVRAVLGIAGCCLTINYVYFSIAKEHSSWSLGIWIGINVALWVVVLFGIALVYIEKRYENHRK